MAYLHGVETIISSDLPKSVSEARTSIIGIVGTANPAGVDPANWKVNEPVVLLKESDIVSVAGKPSDDYTLNKYLTKMYEQFTDEVPVVVVVNALPLTDGNKTFTEGSTISLEHKNVCDVVVKKGEGAAAVIVPTTDYTVDYETGVVTITNKDITSGTITYKYGEELYIKITDEPQTVSEKKVNLDYSSIKDLTVTFTGIENVEENTHYSVDLVNGIITILDSTKIPEETVVTASYAYSKEVLNVVGATSPARTGVNALIDAKTLTGYTPKIIGAPGFSHIKKVADVLSGVADNLKARFYVDADMETNPTVSDIITARNGKKPDAFATHSKRGTLLFPELIYDKKKYPASVAAMGVRARTDMDSSKGYHWSISSQEIKGFDGISIPVEYSINNSSAESQHLNSEGIVTIKNVSGLKFCGNENSSFDTNNSGNTDSERFEVTMTIGDVIEESIELYTEQRIDQPITSQWILGIVRDVNLFLRNLTGRGVIAGGLCWYEPDSNDVTDLSKGEIKFSYDDAATPPANKVTYYRSQNLDYLANLGR